MGSLGFSQRALSISAGSLWRIVGANRRAGVDTAKSQRSRRATVRCVAALCSLLAWNVAPSAAVAEEHLQAHTMLSGLATNALIYAYEASGLNAGIAAPIRLQTYVVMIYTSGDNFWIMMSDTTSTEVHNILVDARTGKILWRSGDPGGDADSNPTLSEALMLPGVIAGEIILAHREASKVPFTYFNKGAYSTILTPRPGGTYIAFEQAREPTTVSLSPGPNAAIPDYAVRGYFVMVARGRISILPTVRF